MPEDRRRGRAVRGLFTVCVLVALAGCQNKPEPPPRVPVKGKVVTAGNQPVPWILVVFHPRDSADATLYRGGTEQDGSFKLTCPAGSYRVTLAPLQGGVTDSGPGVKTAPGKSTAIPARYRSLDWTTLTAEVPAEGKSDVVLEVR
jgi:hypothetical protein